LIETVYIDVMGADPRRTSRYTLLIERLQEAEAAMKVHDDMARRVRHKHVERIAQIRRDLEAEGQRLRDSIRVTKAAS
jgi:hypothetical protein